MKKIAWVTCEKHTPFHAREMELIESLKKDYNVESLVWTRKTPKENEYDAVIIRTPWDYYERIEEFKNWAGRLPEKNVFNPKEVLIWNLDKVYLQELEQAGVPIVPTIWLSVETEKQLMTQVADAPWDDLILKPTRSAGAYKTIQIRKTDRFDATQYVGETVMIQPFLKEILRRGELSLLYFGEVFSHAVCKKPKENDFRVQYIHGGSETPYLPDETELNFGKQIHDALHKIGFPKLLYSRVDFLNTEMGIQLMELEVLEPDLFLKSDAQSISNFKKALASFFKKTS